MGLVAVHAASRTAAPPPPLELRPRSRPRHRPHACVSAAAALCRLTRHCRRPVASSAADRTAALAATHTARAARSLAATCTFRAALAALCVRDESRVSQAV